jgi:hypothetical protein
MAPKRTREVSPPAWRPESIAGLIPHVKAPDVWRTFAGCWSCGAPPVGTYRDGSPRYDCRHEPVRESGVVP